LIVGGEAGGRRSDAHKAPTGWELPLGVGACVVPGAFALAAWWFGWRTGVLVASAVAAALALVCWVLCRGDRSA
jgi:hypothetical protein